METKNENLIKNENSIERVIAYMYALGIRDIKIDDDYNSRVKVQKVAFIMNTLVGGLEFEDFSFRIKGPYSHNLTVQYFEHKDEFNLEPKHILEKKESEQIEKIKTVMQGALDSETLEIVASLLYLVNIEKLDYDAAEIELLKRKPHLLENAVWRGTNLLKSLLLTEEVRTKIMADIGKEMEEFDRASNKDMSKSLVG